MENCVGCNLILVYFVAILMQVDRLLLFISSDQRLELIDQLMIPHKWIIRNIYNIYIQNAFRTFEMIQQSRREWHFVLRWMKLLYTHQGVNNLLNRYGLFLLKISQH